ncbi:MAG: hypothetical protein C3F12_12940 [Candidatus Methylomirabilota bacterium]|nr:hypothetical protein [candidate division NC10 bacterium]PWB42820.1 MAG: hypothetical protein C3F12_12940 [candidate division NC10 bacterium]
MFWIPARARDAGLAGMTITEKGRMGDTTLISPRPTRTCPVGPDHRDRLSDPPLDDRNDPAQCTAPL